MRKNGNLLLSFGLAIVLSISVVAIFAPWIAPHDPYAVNLQNALRPSSMQFPLGTDQLGRCVLSRLIYGARLSLGIAVMALIATVVLGSIMGLISGFFGGILDRVILWLCDVVFAFPGTLLALVIVGMFGSNMKNLILSIAAVSWAGYARNIRSLVRTERNADYVKLAVVCGASPNRIIFRHILPNVLMPAVTLSISGISGMVMRIAGLSFIGLGASLPAAEWGLMISSSRQVLLSHSNLIITAIGAVFLTALGFTLIGDGLRDKMDFANEALQ